MAIIDRKIKFHISPKANVAIKILRGHIGTLLAQLFRGKPLSEEQVRWFDLALAVLGKVKMEPVDGGNHAPIVLMN